MRGYNSVMRVVSILVFLAALAYGQAPVEMAKEPHHSLLLQNNLIRVFETSLNANEEMQVAHKHNFLIVTLDDCDVSMWRQGGSGVQNYHFNPGDARFYFEGQPIGTRNNRAALCRTVVVEFQDAKVTTYGYQWSENGKWEYGMYGMDWPAAQYGKFVNPLRLGSAVTAGVQLLPKDSFSPISGSIGELVIPIRDVDLEGNTERIHKSAGEVFWTGAEQKTDLLNVGVAPAQLVVVELF